MRSALRDSTPFLYLISRSVRHSLSTILCYWFTSLFTILALSISSRRYASLSMSPPSLWYYFREVLLASICSFRSSDKWLSSTAWNEASTTTWRVPRIKDSKRGFESLLRRLFILSSHSYDASATWWGFFGVRGAVGKDGSSTDFNGVNVLRFFRHFSQFGGYIPDFLNAFLIVYFISVCRRI